MIQKQRNRSPGFAILGGGYLAAARTAKLFFLKRDCAGPIAANRSWRIRLRDPMRGHLELAVNEQNALLGCYTRAEEHLQENDSL